MIILYGFPWNRRNILAYSYYCSSGFLNISPLDLKRSRTNQIRLSCLTLHPPPSFELDGPVCSLLWQPGQNPFLSLFIVSPEDGTAASHMYACMDPDRYFLSLAKNYSTSSRKRHLLPSQPPVYRFYQIYWM